MYGSYTKWVFIIYIYYIIKQYEIKPIVLFRVEMKLKPYLREAFELTNFKNVEFSTLWSEPLQCGKVLTTFLGISQQKIKGEIFPLMNPKMLFDHKPPPHITNLSFFYWFSGWIRPFQACFEKEWKTGLPLVENSTLFFFKASLTKN